MPGKLIPCALCQEAAAAVYCVNDDAHLCASCDTSVHAANPLLARHERRPLSALACQAECASAAQTRASSEIADVAVVPEVVAPVQTVPTTAAEPATATPMAPATAAVPEQPPAVPAPLALYEDSFLGRSLCASDLLDFEDDDLLELPSSSGAGAFSFDPMSDCVVPSFDDCLRPVGGERYLEVASSSALSTQQTATSSFLSSPTHYMPTYLKQQRPAAAPAPATLVPMAGSGAAPVPQQQVAAVQQQQRSAAPLDPESEAARVQRHRERQRKKRAFGRAVRYQSRRAYAEIRPRIKGRFVTPEEYAAYQAQMAGGGKAGSDMGMPTYAAPGAAPASPEHLEEDAVVPMPAFVAAV